MVIGNGAVSHIAPFRKATGYGGILLTDPELKTYRALNFRSGMGSMIGLKSVAAVVRSVGNGHTGGMIQGNALQQGGALVVGPGNTVRYFYQSREAGDKPPVAELLRAGEAGE
ncbi:hypothetical protein DENIS_1414 [Desulfonema ishimotonii]|uniref:Uncharacterized protein n=1 Tax=Desulfonema ishimotonii TaxID=45657 RepID=A0A401FU22_9BACT|nr:hypothetical protein DENIS_1414 [Desulfonema ishimotonii]